MKIKLIQQYMAPDDGGNGSAILDAPVSERQQSYLDAVAAIKSGGKAYGAAVKVEKPADVPEPGSEESKEDPAKEADPVKVEDSAHQNTPDDDTLDDGDKGTTEETEISIDDHLGTEDSDNDLKEKADQAEESRKELQRVYTKGQQQISELMKKVEALEADKAGSIDPTKGMTEEQLADHEEEQEMLNDNPAIKRMFDRQQAKFDNDRKVSIDNQVLASEAQKQKKWEADIEAAIPGGIKLYNSGRMKDWEKQNEHSLREEIFGGITDSFDSGPVIKQLQRYAKEKGISLKAKKVSEVKRQQKLAQQLSNDAPGNGAHHKEDVGGDEHEALTEKQKGYQQALSIIAAKNAKKAK